MKLYNILKRKWGGKRGGKRPGAGRKPYIPEELELKKEPYVSNEVLDWNDCQVEYITFFRYKNKFETHQMPWKKITLDEKYKDLPLAYSIDTFTDASFFKPKDKNFNEEDFKTPTEDGEDCCELTTERPELIKRLIKANEKWLAEQEDNEDYDILVSGFVPKELEEEVLEPYRRITDGQEETVHQTN